jgi:hypothetical protein
LPLLIVRTGRVERAACRTALPRERFRSVAHFGRHSRVGECLLVREERKSGLRSPISVFDPACVKTPTRDLRVESPSRFRRLQYHCTDGIYLWTAIEQTILHVFYCYAFSHSLDPKRTLDVWPHLWFGGQESYRELRRELLYWLTV